MMCALVIMGNDGAYTKTLDYCNLCVYIRIVCVWCVCVCVCLCVQNKHAFMLCIVSSFLGNRRRGRETTQLDMESGGKQQKNKLFQKQVIFK